MTPADEKAIADRETVLAPWRAATFMEDVIDRADKLSVALKVLAEAQRVAAQSVAKDAEQMRQAAERAPAAQRASDIARDAAVLFVDRTTERVKGFPADEAMRECVRLAAYARKQAEAT